MKRNRAFTLIELLVVISIIALMSSVVLTGLNSTKAKTRDAKRFSDLNQIRTALLLYYEKCGTYVVRQNCTGNAYGATGNGWFNYATYGGSAGSVAQGLIDEGIITSIFIDPSGQITSNGVNRSGYMIVTSASNYTLWANLENPTAANMATLNTCYSSSYDGYPSPPVPAAAQMNYCISN